MKSVFKNFVSEISSIIRPKKVLLIFVGDLVLECLNDKYDTWRKECDMLFIHTDMSQAKMYQRFKKLKHLYIGDDDFRNTCGKREFEEGESYVDKNSDKILKELNKHKKKKIILISTLRYSSACGITTSLFSYLHDKGYYASVIGIKPFAFEGKSAFENYNKAIEVMDLWKDKITIIEPCDKSYNSFFISQILNTIIDSINNTIRTNRFDENCKYYSII